MTKQDELRVDVTLRSLTARALAETKGNRSQAAILMGISLRTMRNWIRKYDLGQRFPPAKNRQK